MVHQYNRKAQVWSFDIIIGVTLFLTAVILFYVYAVNFSNEGQNAIEELNKDGEFVSSNLLSEGFPKNWNLTNVAVPGIASQRRINQTKLDLFYQLNAQSYNTTRRKLNTRFDFYVFFSNRTVANGSVIDGIGKPGLNRTTILNAESPRNIIASDRYVIYNNEPMVMTVYLWEK